MNGREIDEVLEALWVCSENKDHHIDALKKCCHVPVDEELLATLETDGLIAYQGEMVLLTGEGKSRAAVVTRRKLLAERLLVDVLSMPLQQAEAGACEFEHILAPQVEESICTLLGHPKECPHGEPIPPGKCCVEARNVVDNVVAPLSQLEAGKSGRVAYISTPSHTRLHKLTALGLTPGMTVRVHQKTPSFVISCGQTEIALEEAVVRDIYVWQE